jgi:hypothetical protein
MLDRSGGLEQTRHGVGCWFLAHHPDLMASLTEQEALDFVDGTEAVL